jgi:hypothetical protein
LNQNIRIKFGQRFPFYLTDANESEREYFLQELKQQISLSNIFLTDVEDGARRGTIALKLWAGATTAAKTTRRRYNIDGRQQEYNFELRKAGLQKADNSAKTDEIVCAGVQVAPIVELVVRNHNAISLDGSAHNSLSENM